MKKSKPKKILGRKIGTPTYPTYEVDVIPFAPPLLVKINNKEEHEKYLKEMEIRTDRYFYSIIIGVILIILFIIFYQP